MTSSANELPLLIVAQSARFLAQSAQQAGRRVWVADCFNDVDTILCAERIQRLPQLDKLTVTNWLDRLRELSQGTACQLVYGGGFEHHPTLLDALPKQIQLLGNTPKTLRQITQPHSFFTMLTNLSLPFPEISWQPPEKKDGWLFKPYESLGGINIFPAHSPLISTVNKGYFQRKLTGTSGSALFLADGAQTQLIGLNRQWCAPAPQAPFRLGAIEPLPNINDSHIAKINAAIMLITQSTGLVGLNSLDFIISDSGALHFLEINPRPSASAELYDNKGSLLTAHLSACQQTEEPKLIYNQHNIRQLSYLFAAEKSMRIPKNMQWPTACHDIPAGNTEIAAHQPICTLLLSGQSPTSRDQQQYEADILSQIYSPPKS